MKCETLDRVVGVVDVPECWSDLVGKRFDLSDVKKARHHQKGLDDPEPYYDDERCVLRDLPFHYQAAVELISGQSNYFGTVCIIHTAKEKTIHCSPAIYGKERLANGVSYEDENGVEVVVDIVFE
jgi:hypothetical protein